MIMIPRMCRLINMLRVTTNIYGNYRGYLNSKIGEHLGCNSYDALCWFRDKLESNPDIKIAKSSHFQKSDL